MNVKQLIVLLAAVILFALSELFPPWFYKDSWTSEKCLAGYHFINNPPKEKPIGELRNVFTQPDQGPPRRIHVYRDMLLVYGQRLTLLFLAIGLLLTLSKRKSRPKVALAGLSLIVGFAFLGFCIWHSSSPRWY